MRTLSRLRGSSGRETSDRFVSPRSVSEPLGTVADSTSKHWLLMGFSLLVIAFFARVLRSFLVQPELKVLFTMGINDSSIFDTDSRKIETGFQAK